MRALIVALTVLCACGGTSTPAANTAAATQAAPAQTPSATAPVAAPAGPRRIAIRQVLVRFAGAEAAPSNITRTREAALTRANMIAGLIRDGGSTFQEVGRRYGDGMSAEDESQDGRTIVRGESGLAASAESAAFALDIGDVSDPVETSRGFVVIKRLADPPAGPREIAARHILIQYVGSRGQGEEVTRTKEEARALVQDILNQLRSGATWESLTHHSDEPGAADRHGDLGVFGRGAMVPAFEHIAFNLEVNQTSDVVETEFGFHIIQRYR